MKQSGNGCKAVRERGGTAPEPDETPLSASRNAQKARFPRFESTRPSHFAMLSWERTNPAAAMRVRDDRLDSPGLEPRTCGPRAGTPPTPAEPGAGAPSRSTRTPPQLGPRDRHHRGAHRLPVPDVRPRDGDLAGDAIARSAEGARTISKRLRLPVGKDGIESPLSPLSELWPTCGTAWRSRFGDGTESQTLSIPRALVSRRGSGRTECP